MLGPEFTTILPHAEGHAISLPFAAEAGLLDEEPCCGFLALEVTCEVTMTPLDPESLAALRMRVLSGALTTGVPGTFWAVRDASSLLNPEGMPFFRSAVLVGRR